MKKKILILITAIVAFILLLIFIPKSPNNIKIGVNYLPEKDKIYLDNGELSYFVNPLVYPSSIKMNKNGYDKILAQSIKIKENIVTVKYNNNNIAQNVYDSYLLLIREPYENNWKCLNIEGVNDYQQYLSSEISGMEIVNNTIKFTVSNTNDLEFLTIPTVCGEVGDYSIAEYVDYESITLKNSNKNIIIKKTTNDDKDIDLYITGNSEIEMNNKYALKEIYPYYNYIVLANYNEEESKIIKDIIAGKTLKDKKGIDSIYYWCDSSAQAYYITEDLREKFTNNNVEFRNDYGEYWYLTKKATETSDKFIFYYEDNYYDESSLNLSNCELIKTESKKIYLYYKENVKNIISKYF